MLVGAKSDIGNTRKINQDTFYVSKNEKYPIYLVADGMGGHKAGEVASTMVKDIVVEHLGHNKIKLKKELQVLKIIKKAIEEANTKIYLKSLQDEEYQGMGTTIVVSYVGKKYVYIGHVGDSRAYIIKGEKIEQLTEDHSLVNRLIKMGNITKEEARSHPQKNIITRAVGTSSIIEIDLIRQEYEDGDILLLMSDGVTNMLSDEEIFKEFKTSMDLQNSCKEIIKKANDLGGFDNSTIVAIKFSDEVKI